MDLEKKPYQISLWEDKLKYAVRKNDDTIIITENLPESFKEITNNWMDENLIAVIGANDTTSPIQAFNPSFTTNINGSHKLVFNMFFKFYDDSENCVRDNPFIKLITNERKIKLNYDGEWYDFIIKKINESSDQRQMTVTCEDQYITELGKNGYDITFDVELDNNMGTITDLAKVTMEDTDWKVVAPGEEIELYNKDTIHSDVLFSKLTEALYVYELKDSLSANSLDSNESIIIPKGQVILISSTSYMNHSSQIQFLWVENGLYKVNGDQIVSNSENYVAKVPFDYDKTTLYVSSQYRGEMYVNQPVTKWIDEINECAEVFTRNNEDYYGILRTEYLGQSETQELLLNNNNFSSKDYWEPDKITDFGYDLTKQTSFLQLNFGKDGYVANRGIQVNLNQFDPLGINASTTFIFAIRTESNSNISGANLWSLPRNAVDPQYYERTSCSTLPSNIDLPNFKMFRLSSIVSLSYEDIVQQNWELRIRGAGSVKVLECLLFKEHYDQNNKLVIPDMATAMDQVVQEVYYLFKTDKISDKISSLNQIALDDKIEKSKLEEKGYTQKAVLSPYEKVTSISASKSNRFNILQTLCETFKCWARFTIDHDDTGHIIYSYDLIDDEIPYTGKSYFKKIGNTGLDSDYELIQPSQFFTKASSYSKVTNDKTGYWAQDTANLFTKVDLGFQYSDPSMTYYVNKNDSYIRASGEYDLNTIYYIQFKNTDGQVYYQRVPVTNEFATGNYYILSSNFNNKSVYERNYHKYITFLEFIGKENQAGFKYGINLQSINRSIDSTNLCTRLIVPANNNEYADSGDGFCSIQTSSLNPSGESAIYNFQYFLNQKLLSPSDLSRDLYGDTTGGLAYLNNLAKWNKDNNPKITEQAKLRVELSHLISRRQVFNALIEESNAKIDEYVSNLMTAANLTEVEARSIQYNEKTNSDVVNSLIKERDTLTSIIQQYTGARQQVISSCNIIEQKYNEISTKLASVSEKKKALNKEFYKKYSRFIQEGTWQSEDYINADRYYLAACDVMVTSGMPQISYTINAIDISRIEGYKQYSFKVGDKTWIEDTEFFGWVPGTNRPYQEEVVVSEIVCNLDDPSQNLIRIQNYKTRFDDLFSRIAAATQSLQYNEGYFARGGDAVNPNGTLSGDLLKKSLAENSAIISNANDQSVVWDETGITISDLVHTNKQIRLVGGGIAMTNDGGNNWYTGVTADGINASKITTGSLNTNLISIYNDQNPTFTWDQYGLNSYATDSNGTNFGKFVRMDQYGLYGIIGADGNSYKPINGITSIKEDSYFSLTWDGVQIKGTNNQGGIASLTSDGEGLRLNFANNNRNVSIGLLDATKIGDSSIHEVINANNNFIVYDDGSIIANNGKFNGEITAKTGRFYGDVYLGDKGNKTLQQILDEIAANATAAKNAALQANTAASQATAATAQANEAIIQLAGKLNKSERGYGGIDYNSGSGTNISGYGIKMFAYADSYGSIGPYVAATRNGTSLYCDQSHQLYVVGSGTKVKGAFYVDDTLISSSDKRIKDAILYNMEKYNVFFDKLKPTQYRFKKGESNRFHIGFIAQDVEKAILDSHLTSLDFAGFVDSNKNGTSKIEKDEPQYYLRYEEFIALNTYQIQQLKEKIKALESKLDSLQKV